MPHRMPSKPDDAVDTADKSLVETLVVVVAAAFVFVGSLQRLVRN